MSLLWWQKGRQTDLLALSKLHLNFAVMLKGWKIELHIEQALISVITDRVIAISRISTFSDIHKKGGFFLFFFVLMMNIVVQLLFGKYFIDKCAWELLKLLSEGNCPYSWNSTLVPYQGNTCFFHYRTSTYYFIITIISQQSNSLLVYFICQGFYSLSCFLYKGNISLKNPNSSKKPHINLNLPCKF